MDGTDETVGLGGGAPRRASDEFAVQARAVDGGGLLVVDDGAGPFDLLGAGVVALGGPAPLVDEALGDLARGLARDRPDALGRVVAFGVDPGPLPCPVVRAGRPGEALGALDAGDLPGEQRILVLAGHRVACDALGELVALVRAERRAVLLSAQLHPDAAVLVALDDHRRASLFRRASHEGQVPTVASAADPAVEVAVLGPIAVRGALVPLERRPKLTELVVYLAMHPEGATTRTWSTALWPDRRVPAQTIANRLSEARTALGFASDGQARLRRAGERHRIAEIDTDWRRFLALSDEHAGPPRWHEALGLLRGRPFADLHEGRWTELEGFVGEIDQRVVACGLRFGEHELAAGRPDEAAWGVQRALRTSPWDERLYRLLMRAADAAGNWAGVEASMRHLALVLEVDGDPLDAVHPETAALYARLCGERALARR